MNAFDFHDEISTEEKVKKEKQAKIDAVRKAEAIESALIGSKSVQGSGVGMASNMITFGVVHTAKALGTKAQNKMDTGEFTGMQAGEKKEAIMAGHTDSTTVTVGGITATATVDGDHHFKAQMKVKAIEKEKAFKAKYGHDKNWKKGPKKQEEEQDPLMKKIALAAIKRAKREERREAREKRRKEGELMLQENAAGRDDGKGAQKLLGSYVDEVLAIRQVSSQFTDNIPAHVTEKDKFKYCNFVSRLNRPELHDIPLVSQLVRQKALQPVHSDQDKRMFYDVCQRLRRNDGGLVRLQLNLTGVDDGVAHQLSLALEKNKYAQHIMLHDNRVTDTGVEGLCSALRWHPSVHTLWLGNNPVGDRGAEALARLVHLNHNLKDINVSNQRPPKTWGGGESEADSTHLSVTYLGAAALAKSLRMQCQLTSINLADQRIRDKGARALFTALPPSFIRTLNLKNNKLTSRCCAALRDVLVTTHLQQVTQGTMQYQPPGSWETDRGRHRQSFSDGLASRPGTGQSQGDGLGRSRSPSPSGRQSRGRGDAQTRGTDDSGKSVLSFTTASGRVVEKPLTLELLDLSENDIDCDGAADLAYALCYNKTLKSLNLQKCLIDDRGIGELLASLQYNQVIRSIVTLYNVSEDERVDRVLELRTAAVQALEDHVDRAQMREQYHDTGFMVDRSGTYGEKSVGRSRGANRSISPGGNSLPGTPQAGMPLPQFSAAQLADYQDSRGNMGIDTGSGGLPPRSAATTEAGSAPGSMPTTASTAPGSPSAPGSATGLSLPPTGIGATAPVTKTPGFSDDSLNVLVKLASEARAQNDDPGVSAITGARQQPIDFTQVAMPVHALGLARSGLNSREQTFDKRVRKELIPARKRKLPPGQQAQSAPTSSTGHMSPPGSPGGMGITAMGAEFGFMNSPGGSFTPGAEGISRGNSPNSRTVYKGDVRNALSSEERDIVSPLPRSRSRGKTTGLRGSSAGIAGLKSPTRPYLKHEALMDDDQERQSVLSDVYDAEMKPGSYTHLHMERKRASTAPVQAGGNTAGGGFNFKSEAGAKGWGLTLTGLGLGDASDRAQRDEKLYTVSAFETKSHGGKLGRPEASMGGVSSGGMPSRPSTTGSSARSAIPIDSEATKEHQATPTTPTPGSSELVEDVEDRPAVAISDSPSTVANTTGELSPGPSAGTPPLSPGGGVASFPSIATPSANTATALAGIAITPIKSSSIDTEAAPPSSPSAPPKSPLWGPSRSRSSSPSRTDRLPPSRGQPLPLILTEPDHGEGDDESEAAAQAALAVAGMEEGQSDTGDDSSSSSENDDDFGPPSMPGVPIDRNQAIGMGGNLNSFLDMFESEEEEKTRLEKEEQARMKREKEEELARQAEEDRLRQEEEEKKRKKKKGGKRASASTASASSSSPGSPGQRRKSAGGRAGSLSSGLGGSSSSGSDSDSSPMASPKRVKGRKSRPPSVTFDESNGGISAPGSPVASPGKGRRRSRADSDTSSASAGSDASPSPPRSPVARAGSAARGSRPGSGKELSERKQAEAELAKIEAAAPLITEKMRLGSTLPNSPYRRYFSKEGKPVYNTDLGKTRGVPLIPSMGVRPIRSASGGFRDSGKHIGYLGVLTPDDPVGARPLSLVEIAKQQQAHRDAIVVDRQSEVYKELKKDVLDQQPRGRQRAAALPVPEKFWTSWRRNNRLRYPNGIDRATGTTSTNISELRTMLKNKDGSIIIDADARERMSIKTPGEALAYRRKKRAEEIARERTQWHSPQAVSLGRAKKLTHDMLGLRPNQTVGDLTDPSKGLTTRLETMKPVTPMGPKNKFAKPNI